MKPPYEITGEILKLLSSVSEKIGEVNARHLTKANPILRKQNKIKTIHSSLHIEGNTLSEAQVTAIIENKKVTGPQKDITEVLNALEVYQHINKLTFNKEKDFLKAHKMLMKNLAATPGKYRTKGVGVVKGSKVQHLAPPYNNVPALMKQLFEYVGSKQEISLIKSCVFHYEMEFIHPFMDGNGRMGRLWQTVILMNEYPLFEYLPFETLISKNQAAYYKALAAADKQGKSTLFIEYMLHIIDQSLEELLQQSSKKLTENDRILIFLENCDQSFSRKDYIKHFKGLSSATASRDLKKAIDMNLISKKGDKKTTVYKKTN